MSRKSPAALATKSNRPPPPSDTPPEAAALWVSICVSVMPDYFARGDLVLLEPGKGRL